jgi:cytochrome c-type biogenesis protein CcmH/NrfG
LGKCGGLQRAKEIVQERLAIVEKPKMWAAMGDLTNDPVHYEKVYTSLGHYYFD